MLELLFLLSFTLHNIEEGLWLPKWSRYAKKYHPEVTNNEFHFALIVVTTLGYLVTFLYLTFGHNIQIIKYLYLAFVLMMCLNSIFPHLIATIVLKKYAPGTLTGLLLNLPIGLTLLVQNINQGIVIYKFAIIAPIFIALTLSSLRPLFKLGKRLIDEY